MKKLIAAVVLPDDITQFERSYLARMNRIALVFFAAHVPFLATVAFVNETGALVAAALAAFGVAGPWLASRTLPNPRHVSMVFGVTAMFMGALLVHFGRGLWTIEMHFYFFVALALLAVFANPMVIVGAAVTVALHHLGLWLVAPQSVFNYDAPLSSVLVHATFVVVESVAACFVARSFFDNVIGLERIVAARTSELDGKNREMRLVFDHVQQGFLTLDGEGRLLAQHSKIAGTWFGAPTPGQTGWAYFGAVDPAFGQWLELGWESVRDGFLPLEVSLEQLPRRFKRGGQSWEVQYQPVLEGERLNQVLVLVSDITERLKRERSELTQRETLAVFEKLSRDRAGFLEFFSEAKDSVRTLISEPPPEGEVARRLIHTLKGNAALFGLSSVSRACHEVETRIAEQHDEVTRRDRHDVGAAWDDASGRVMRFLEGGTRSAIELEEAEYLAIVQAIDHGAPRAEVMKLIASWRNEPVRVRFERIAEQAQSLADRTGKGPIQVTVDSGALRLPREQFTKVWAALTHVTRNAVDHGLLPKEERPGQLELAARSEAGAVVLSFRDNGRGIDWDKVRVKARQSGLPNETLEDLEQALFAAGLTTRDEASELSGRGVGMGAVKEVVESLGGTIRVRSERNAGTTVELRFPEAVVTPADPREPLSAAVLTGATAPRAQAS